jgi:two-component system chemotaxis sensor kinase CheA
VIKGQATEVIDVGHFLPMAFADWFSRKEMRPSASAQSVLLVDDSAFFRNMLAPVLKAAGYKVRTAGGAQEGLAALRAGSFDVVLTDIEMPEMNGFEFAENIRSDHNLIGLPIIALSAMVSPAAIERGRQAGFPRLCRQVRSSRADRGAQGTDRRTAAGGLSMIRKSVKRLSDQIMLKQRARRKQMR